MADLLAQPVFEIHFFSIHLVTQPKAQKVHAEMYGTSHTFTWLCAGSKHELGFS